MSAPGVVVTGIDLGTDTESVISYAAYIASKTGASIKLLYVIDFLLTPPSYLSSYLEEEKKRDEKELARWSGLLRDAGMEAEYEIVLGRLNESFLKAVEDKPPVLLVIGFKTHALRPSSSERLIKSLNTHMLVVRGESSLSASIGHVDIRKILCPVDFSDNSAKAAVTARDYSALFGAELDIVHVVSPPPARGKEDSRGATEKTQRDRSGEELLSDTGDRMAFFLGKSNISVEGKVHTGIPYEKILSLAHDGRYDMIVLGARGLSFVRGLLTGSTTDSVLRSSPCPVLIVH